MPDTKINKQPKDMNQKTPVFSAPPAILLRFRKPLILIAHIFCFAASLMLAFLLLHNMAIKRSWFIELYPVLLLFFLIVKLPVFGLFRQYRGWWRFVGISDLLSI